MKLIRLRLNNFRSFYGETEISFSTDKELSVTLFVGKNGAGKTTLLNAIYWAFSGLTTPRLVSPERLVHNWAVKEGEKFCSVELWFSVGDEGSAQYRILREGRNGSQESDLKVWKVLDGGIQEPLPSNFALAVLKKFLPTKLITWFFFDGEAIDKLSLDGRDGGFRKDIRRAFGFEQVDTLISDLNWIEKKIRSEISQQTKDIELDELNESLTKIDKNLESLSAQREARDIRLQTIKSKLQACRDELSSLPDSKQLMREIDEEEGRLIKLKTRKDDHQSSKAKTLGSAAAPILVNERSMALAQALNVKEFSQKLPAPFGDKLVDDILHDGICICGREVTENSPEEACLNKKRDVANTGLLANRVTRFRTFVKNIEMLNGKFAEAWVNDVNAISDLDSLVGQSEEALKALSQTLQGMNVSRVKELEQNRLRLEKEEDEAKKSLWSIETDLAQQQNLRRTKESELKVKEKSISIGSELGEEYRKVALVREYVVRALAQQEEASLQVLKEEMTSVIDKYLTKSYSIEIDPSNYRIVMRDVLGNQVAPATGEGVLLKYAFIASMIGMSARNSASEIDWLSEPVVAPLCLDAPFTALDEEYKSDVVKIITGKCEQLILFLNTDSLDQVSSDLYKKVGKTYLMKFYASSDDALKEVVKQSKTATIGKKTYTFTFTGAERDESKLEEIRL